jgi:cyclophilin family peptidyl-prolyl cis-trans isomerase
LHPDPRLRNRPERFMDESFSDMPRLLRLLFFALLLGPALHAQDGIYADFATSMGTFTCQLHYDRAPRTVANFISLATGERAWLDIPKGEVKTTPFYNGITFHRVVSGFVIQGGSPNGIGTDGPGYTFKDEFNATLRHNAAGVLSMANSGKNSNGSQFFVTLAATPNLDDVHSVFGNVTAGMNVVNAIGAVPVDGASKPLTPVIMQSVTIRRVGVAAQAFDVTLQGLPTVGGAKPTLVKNGANLALQFTRSVYSEYWLYDSANFTTWTSQRLGLYIANPPTANLDVSSTAGQPRHFYRVPQIAYPGPIYTPLSVAGSTLTLNVTGAGTVVYAFSASGTGGTCTFTPTGGSPTSGAITGYQWLQEAYRGRIYVESVNLVPILAECVFDTAAGGSFKGTAYQTTPFAISGTFTYSTP